MTLVFTELLNSPYSVTSLPCGIEKNIFNNKRSFVAASEVDSESRKFHLSFHQSEMAALRT